MSKPITIKVTLEFKVDPDVWANEYGLDIDAAKADARDFLPGLVAEHVGELPHVKNGVVDYIRKD